MMLVTFLSSRVWGIEIVGGHVHTKEEMIKQLDRLGVYGGVAMKSVHCGKIEEKIRNKNTDIGWVSIEKRGCVFRMCLKESRFHLKTNGFHRILRRSEDIFSELYP